jgi:hypothetical protein
MKTISFVLAFGMLAILLGALPTMSTQFLFARHHDSGGSSGSNDNSNGGSNDNSGNSGSGSGDNSGSSSSSQPTTLDPANGYQDGVNQARADAESGVAMSASCTAHGIDNVGNEQYCINYKAGYLVEQGALAISH